MPIKFRNALRPEDLRERLNYDPDTGVFTWKVSMKRLIGKRAGTLQHGYLVITVSINGVRQSYLAHRIAWLYVHGEWPLKQIDHINGCRDDNRIANLREATAAQNIINSQRKRSGLRGVQKRWGGYLAYIQHSGRQCYLGSFPTAEEAHAAYRDAARKLHGEFARFD